MFACISTGAATGDGEVDLSVHVPARALDVGADEMAAIARTLVGRHGSPEAFAALTTAMAAAGDAEFGVTVVGLGLPPGGGIGKVNVYAAPGAVTPPGGRRYSNSGYSGSRVGR